MEDTFAELMLVPSAPSGNTCSKTAKSSPYKRAVVVYGVAPADHFCVCAVKSPRLSLPEEALAAPEGLREWSAVLYVRPATVTDTCACHCVRAE